MKMNILAFGIARDILKTSTLEVEMENGSNIGQLMAKLKTQYPKLSELTSLAIALNEEYASDDAVLNERDEIVLIPPVSGG